MNGTYSPEDIARVCECLNRSPHAHWLVAEIIEEARQMGLIPPERRKAQTKMTTAPIADRTLWDSLGNCCRVEMHMLGTTAWDDSFEVYFHEFNDAIPNRFVGPLGICNNKVDLWLASKKAAGFQEQLPSFNPDAYRM